MKEYENEVYRFQNFENARFDGCKFLNCRFDMCNLEGARFNDCIFYGSHIKNCNLEFIHMKDVTITHGLIKDNNIRNANFASLTMDVVSFCYNNLANSILDACEFNKTSMAGTSFMLSTITGKFTKCEILHLNLHYCDISKLELEKCYGKPLKPACPEGAIYGYKEAEGKIVKLFVPEDVKRVATTCALRAESAQVVEILNMNGRKSEVNKVRSYYDEDFFYEVGKTVTCKGKFNKDYKSLVGPGIYFKLNKEEI